MAEAECRLLQLPKELRLEIYEYLLKPWELRMHAYWPAIDPCIQTRCITPDDRCKGTWFGKAEGKQLAPALLRTCHQIHDEARFLLSRPKNLFLEPCYTKYLPEQRIIDLTRLGKITHVHTLVLSVRKVKGSKSETTRSVQLAQQFQPGITAQEVLLDVLFSTSICKEHRQLSEILQAWGSVLRGKSGKYKFAVDQGVLLQLERKAGSNTPGDVVELFDQQISILLKLSLLVRNLLALISQV